MLLEERLEQFVVILTTIVRAETFDITTKLIHHVRSEHLESGKRVRLATDKVDVRETRGMVDKCDKETFVEELRISITLG